MSLSDFHGSPHVFPLLEEKIQEIQPHLILFSGDIVKGYARGDEWLTAQEEGRTPQITDEITAEKAEDEKFYKHFFSFLKALPMPAFVVPGNMDAPEKRFSRFCHQGMSVHRFRIGTYTPHESSTDLIITGFGGELTEIQDEGTHVLQYSRSTIIDSLDLHVIPDQVFAIITHSPPVSSLSMEDGQEKGSLVVNDLVDILHPRYLFCGHAHKSEGTDTLGNTRVINPGALKYGNYAVVRGDSVEFKRL
jgi:Icc-related predicted phosphoesterase